MPKEGIKIYISITVRILEYLLPQNRVECEVVWILVSQVELHCFHHLLETALLGLLPLGSVLGQPLAILNTEAVAEHPSSPAALHSLAGSSTVP